MINIEVDLIPSPSIMGHDRKKATDEASIISWPKERSTIISSCPKNILRFTAEFITEQTCIEHLGWPGNVLGLGAE